MAETQQEGVENTQETRKVVLDDVNAEKKDVSEALKDVNSAVAEEQADVNESVREGNQEIAKAEAMRQKEQGPGKSCSQ